MLEHLDLLHIGLFTQNTTTCIQYVLQGLSLQIHHPTNDLKKAEFVSTNTVCTNCEQRQTSAHTDSDWQLL
jgi:hypothetical protein